MSSQTELDEIEYADTTEIAQKMATGALTSKALTQRFLDRIGQHNKQGYALSAVIEVNSEAISIAKRLDRERAEGRIRGPLHGIPLLIKDNINTGDTMQTTAGSRFMAGVLPPSNDAFVIRKLREAGIVMLGKANMSEWANARDFEIAHGSSGRGGQTKNPHLLDASPCGSSSGSAAGIAAGFATVALGTETNGSLICPAAVNGVVALRPTVGLISRTGVIPLYLAQDTIGPIARSVRDVAQLLNVMVAVDPTDAAMQNRRYAATDYVSGLDVDSLRGKRVGYPNIFTPGGPSIFEKALVIMHTAGAILVPIHRPDVDPAISKQHIGFLVSGLKRDLERYLASRPDTEGRIKTLQDILQFNQVPNISEQLNQTMADGYKQRILETALKFPETDWVAHDQGVASVIHYAQGVLNELITSNRLDVVLDEVDGVDEISPIDIVPMAGYPGITVPSGINPNTHIPTSVYFYGSAGSEAKLLSIAYGFEQATKAIAKPKFLEKIPHVKYMTMR